MRPKACAEHQQASGSADQRGDDDDAAPVGLSEEGREVRRRRAQRQRANQDADQRAAVLQSPAGGDLHADRIDAGEQRAGGKARRDRHAVYR